MRPIDADKLKRKAQKLSTEAWKINRVAKVTQILNQFIDWIEGMPTIDAIEVVRCKDCIHYESDGGAMMICNITDMVCDNDDYCSYGERREGEVEECYSRLDEIGLLSI